MPLIQQRAQTLHMAPFDARWRWQGDLVRLTQVLANLLDNAAKYTPERGEIWLERAARRRERSRSRCVTAAGASAPSGCRLLFDFFRTRGSARCDAASGGLGVGLGLARRLVELHGGRIVARSEGRGSGAQFIVTLPAVRRVVRRGAAGPGLAGAERRRADSERRRHVASWWSTTMSIRPPAS